MYICVERAMNWEDIKENEWAGAVPVLEEIEKQGREEEAMITMAAHFAEDEPGEVQLHDFIRYELADMMHLYD